MRAFPSQIFLPEIKSDEGRIFARPHFGLPDQCGLVGNAYLPAPSNASLLNPVRFFQTLAGVTAFLRFTFETDAVLPLPSYTGTARKPTCNPVVESIAEPLITPESLIACAKNNDKL